MRLRGFAFLLIVLASSNEVHGTVAIVNSHHNIYGAGLGSGPEVVGDGMNPLLAASFPAGPNQVLTFPSVAGTVNYYGGSQPSTESPDGYGPSFQPYPPGGYPTSSASFPGFMGLSGLRDTNNGAYLVGVFLTDAPPEEPAPLTLDFSDNKNFTSLSPLIVQLFFIGDGLSGTGTGDVQQFHVPETATRLYLGFIDSQFSDNLGSLTAIFQVVPEPSSLSLAGIVAIICALARRTRRWGTEGQRTETGGRNGRQKRAETGSGRNGNDGNGTETDGNGTETGRKRGRVSFFSQRRSS
jgi:hypothetical protein